MPLLETLELLRKARKLFDIEVNEVSLVNSPATRKRFLFVKSEDNPERNRQMDKELLELLKALIGDDTEDEDLEKMLKAAVPSKVVAALKSALKVMTEYKDTLPSDLVKSMVVIAKYAVAGYGYPKAPDKDETKKSESDEEDLEKAGRKVSKDTIKQIAAGLKTIYSGMDQLNNILPEDSRVVKSEEEFTPEMQAIANINSSMNALKEQLETLTKSSEKSDDDKDADKDEDKDKDKDKDEDKDLEKRVRDLEKAKATKKSLDDSDDDDPDEDEDLWPSLNAE